MGAVLTLAGCTAILGLRDDYQLASGDGGTPPDGSEPLGDAAPDASSFDADVDAAAVEAPRPTAPLTTRTVSIQTPTLHWALPASDSGAHVQVCKDRACKTIEQEFDATGSSGKVPSALSVGLHYWRLSGNVLTTHGIATSAVWEFWVRKNSGVPGEHDSSFGGFPDFNGDGFADIMAAGGQNPAHVNDTYVFLGNAEGPSNAAEIDIADPDQRADDNFPRAVVGDVDGDGFSDLVVGKIATTASNDQGNHINVFRGGAAFSASTPRSWNITVPPGDVDAGTIVNSFAATVSIPGDVNGDGYADILVATVTPDASDPVLVYYGHADGPSKMPDAKIHAQAFAYYMQPGDGPGDLDGDGFDDIVCTAQNGETDLFFGSAAGPLDKSRRTLNQPANAVAGEFGYMIVGGDLNGDGLPDLGIGAAIAPRLDGGGGTIGGAGPGIIYIYNGDTSVGLVTADSSVLGPDDNGGNFGQSGAIAGDLDGDGFDDLITGAAQVSTNDGRGYFFAGGAAGVSTAHQTLSPTGTGTWFGRAVTGGDINGDGVLDAIFGAGVGGYINVYYGKVGAPITDASIGTTVNAPAFIYILTQNETADGKRGA